MGPRGGPCNRIWDNGMRFLDLTLPAAAENLALDEALLLEAEAGSAGEILRLWEWPRPAGVPRPARWCTLPPCPPKPPPSVYRPDSPSPAPAAPTRPSSATCPCRPTS